MDIVGYDVEDSIATVTLDSQQNRNALSRRMIGGLTDAFDRAERDVDVRVVLVRHSGPVFCSGADLKEAAAGEATSSPLAMIGLQRRIVALSKPVVVRLSGTVRAGGIGLVGAADVVVAASNTTFALPEVRLGLAPAVISLTIVPRMQPRAAQYAFLGGHGFTAAQAAEFGLVTTAVAESDLNEEVLRVCHKLAQGHPQGLAETKRLLNAGLLASIDAHGKDMAELSARLFSSDAAQTAMRAFSGSHA